MLCPYDVLAATSGSRGRPSASAEAVLDLVEEVVRSDAQAAQGQPEHGVPVQREGILSQSVVDEVLRPAWWMPSTSTTSRHRSHQRSR